MAIDSRNPTIDPPTWPTLSPPFTPGPVATSVDLVRPALPVDRLRWIRLALPRSLAGERRE